MSQPIRVGLLSDTHGLLRPEAVERLRGADHIIHAGDVGRPDILVELGMLAPVTAVWGNTDGFDVRAETAEVARIELAGRRVVVVHGHQLGSPTPQGLRLRYPEADVVVFGHTHIPLVDGGRRPLVVNPGAAGPARFRLRPSVAVLELDPAGEEVRILELKEGR